MRFFLIKISHSVKKKWLKTKNAIEVHNVQDVHGRESSGVLEMLWERKHQLFLGRLCFCGSLNYPLHVIFMIMFASLECHSGRLRITMFVVSKKVAIETQPKTFNSCKGLRPPHSFQIFRFLVPIWEVIWKHKYTMQIHQANWELQWDTKFLKCFTKQEITMECSLYTRVF